MTILPSFSLFFFVVSCLQKPYPPLLFLSFTPSRYSCSLAFSFSFFLFCVSFSHSERDREGCFLEKRETPKKRKRSVLNDREEALAHENTTAMKRERRRGTVGLSYGGHHHSCFQSRALPFDLRSSFLSLLVFLFFIALLQVENSFRVRSGLLFLDNQCFLLSLFKCTYTGEVKREDDVECLTTSRRR